MAVFLFNLSDSCFCRCKMKDFIWKIYVLKYFEINCCKRKSLNLTLFPNFYSLRHTVMLHQVNNLNRFKKRERTQNWAYEEKRFLLELCRKDMSIIENKRLDADLTALKNRAWKIVHQEFTKAFGNERNCNRLKEQWRRMKGNKETFFFKYYTYLYYYFYIFYHNHKRFRLEFGKSGLV